MTGWEITLLEKEVFWDIKSIENKLKVLVDCISGKGKSQEKQKGPIMLNTNLKAQRIKFALDHALAKWSVELTKV